MKYLIWVTDEEDTEILYSGPVDNNDKIFFIKEILHSLEPIDDKLYTESFCVILQTMARWSYILFEKDLYWCIEWDPGLIVLKFTETGNIRAVALRSPIPEFGGRTPLEEDLKTNYDEDEENHQYNLVFNAWDAQFDEQDRIWRNFEKASEKEINEFLKCLDHVNNLSDIIEKKYNEAPEQFFELCKVNIANWAGEGKRT